MTATDKQRAEQGCSEGGGVRRRSRGVMPLLATSQLAFVGRHQFGKAVCETTEVRHTQWSGLCLVYIERYLVYIWKVSWRAMISLDYASYGMSN